MLFFNIKFFFKVIGDRVWFFLTWNWIIKIQHVKNSRVTLWVGVTTERYLKRAWVQVQEATKNNNDNVNEHERINFLLHFIDIFLKSMKICIQICFDIILKTAEKMNCKNNILNRWICVCCHRSLRVIMIIYEINVEYIYKSMRRCLHSTLEPFEWEKSEWFIRRRCADFLFGNSELSELRTKAAKRIDHVSSRCKFIFSALFSARFVFFYHRGGISRYHFHSISLSLSLSLSLAWL